MDIICFDNFSFSYAGSERKVIKNMNLAIDESKITILCGKSGSGKTTLLKSIKEEIAPAGKKEGKINTKLKSSEIAIVFQNPDTQLVCGSVIHDLVFHMENLGLEPALIKKRLAETACFFGIEPLLHKNSEELSGGQKQLIALCGALMTYPKLLILDEPLSQLDPIAATEFLELLKRINEEFSVSIIMCEHRLSECMVIGDMLAVLDNGELLYYGSPENVMEEIWNSNDEKLISFIPDITKASLKLFNTAVFLPRELKMKIDNISYESKPLILKQDKPVIRAKNIVFSYPESESYVLKRLSVDIYGGITCLVGGNGSGKSTFLKLIAGIYRKYLGSLKISAKKTAYMPQNTALYFVADNVFDEITFEGYDKNYYSYLMKQLEIENLEKRHPFDLSGGESIRVCIASILLKKPELIILDEPTRGLDKNSKDILVPLLRESGASILMASHDLEFAAQYSDKCIMLFDGDIAYEASPKEFFKENRYYTTGINKAFRHSAPDIITYEDVLRL